MQRNPYKYLDYYTFEDADLFFGREEETQKMVGEILTTRLLVLFSPSGSGKTSLINAGVRPALEKLGYETVYVRLDKDPIPSVQSAVAEAVALSTSDFATSDPQPSDLHSFLRSATVQAGKPLVVFIDQFEEFFIVFHDKPQLRQQFIEQVAKIKYDDQLPVFLVLSLREDYFANLHEFREAIPSIFQNNANIRLEPFTEAEARRAIEEPAKVVGCEYEAGLVERILLDLKNGKPSIEPITLQIVCNAVWEEKSAHAAQITFADYKASGGADHILNNYVSCFLDNLSARQQSLMAKIFTALKTPDDTKRYRAFEDLQATLKLRPSRLKRGLDQLVVFNLLRQEPRAGTNWYEFKHDYLVGEITDWLQQRKERINRHKLIIYGTSPSITILFGLLGYLFYQYNTFYARFIKPEFIQFQQEEVIILREFNPYKEVISTGLLREDVSDQNAANELWDKVQLGFWKSKDWNRLVEKLSLVEGGKFLYRIGQVQDGVDKLLAALQDQKREYKNLTDIDSDPSVQTTALLIKLGKRDSRVIDALLAQLNQWGIHFPVEAAEVLGKLGQGDLRIVDALLALLKNENEYFRAEVAEALGNLGQNNHRVIDALIATLKDKDANVLVRAAAALVNMGYSDGRVIDALIAMLKDEDKRVRVRAAAALVNLGYSEGRIIAVLLDALKNPGYSGFFKIQVQRRAAIALGNLGHSDARVIDALIINLDHFNSDVSEQAAVALGKLGHNDARVIDALIAVLKNYNYNWDIRDQVAALLGKLDHSETRVIDALIAALKDYNSDNRSHVAALLGKLSYIDARVIDALLAALKDKVPDVRVQAIGALGNLGKSDARVIDALLAVLKDQVSNVRVRAAEALVDLGQNDNCVIDTLLAALKDQFSSLRSQAAAALGNLENSNNRVIDALLDALRSFDSNQAAAALGNLGNSDERVITALLTTLENEYPTTGRSQAAAALGKLRQSDDRVIGALGKIKPKDDRMVGALVAALKDQDKDVRAQAAVALGNLLRMNPLPQLLAQLAHPLSGYRTAAAQALAQKDIPIDSTLQVIAQLKEDERPWVCLGAWEAYELLEQRREAEKKSAELLQGADSLFASGNWQVASGKYESAFEENPKVTHTDSLNAARAKFQQARCAAKLKRVGLALDDLKIAFEYNPTSRDTLQAEMAKPENDWKILEGNWYLREVLLKATKAAPNIAPK